MDRKQHIDKYSFKQAGSDLLKRVRQAEQIDKQQILAAWAEIEVKTAPSRKPLVGRLRYIASIAASLAILISVGFFMYNQETDNPALSLALLDKAVPALSAEEILLIAESNQQQLKNDVAIKYTANGQPDIDKQIIQAETNQLVVPKGRLATVTFSEGTKMYVKAGTRVIYPTVFRKDKREILVEGEVYLEVSKDPARPFIVKANGFDVKVLGTAFNVSAYKGVPSATVVLVNGSVEVETAGDEKALLAPNQLMEISDKGTDIKEVDVFAYVCWKDHMMLLDGKTLGDVLDNLSAYYGRILHCADDVRAIPVSGKLDLREEATDVVDILCQSLLLHYSIDHENKIEILK